MKYTWKGIRQSINLKPKSFKAPTKSIKNNIELVEGKSSADAFNDFFFFNIGSKLPQCVWLHSSVASASHRYCGGHGFESR